MRKFAQISFAALIISLVACGQNSQTRDLDEIPENWKALNEANYSIHYPDSFDLDKSGQMGLSFVLISRHTSAQDLFRENINLAIQDLAGYNLNLDQYVEISEGQIKSMISNGKIIKSERKTRDNSEEFHRIVYTGQQGQYDLKWLQYYWVIDEKAYVLTLTCETNQFDNYFQIGEQIMNTFSLK